jgi:Cu-Zn family superoxide dismutase
MRVPVLSLAAVLLLAACAKEDKSAADSTTTPSSIGPAPGDSAAAGATGNTVAMRDSAGRDLGTLTLSDAAGGIMIMGDLRGVRPGEHAIHLHMTGSCEPTFAAAGGHWNPTNKAHGKDAANGPHLGDFPNITVGADSTVSIHVTSPGGTLSGENALLDTDGAAIVIHAAADDYKSQPAGNAGDRIACGAVRK